MTFEETLERSFHNALGSLESALEFTADSEIHTNTPKRITDMMMKDLLIGYKQKPEEILSKRFKTANSDMVIVKDIPFFSICEHHWLPFIGKAHFAYIPKNGNIIGLSKIPRLVECFSRRFQTQESLCKEIADSFYSIVKPEGCMIIMEAQHLCSSIRGIKAVGSSMVCSALRGCFEKSEIKEEFLKLIK